MKIKDLEPGVIFTIEETPTYPKLRLEKGYVDLRDDIFNEEGESMDQEVREMLPDEVAKALEQPIEEVEEWLEAKRLQYLEGQTTIDTKKEDTNEEEDMSDESKDTNTEAPRGDIKGDAPDYRPEHNHSFHFIGKGQFDGVPTGYYRLNEGVLEYAPEANQSIDRSKIEKSDVENEELIKHLRRAY